MSKAKSKNWTIGTERRGGTMAEGLSDRFASESRDLAIPAAREPKLFDTGTLPAGRAEQFQTCRAWIDDARGRANATVREAHQNFAVEAGAALAEILRDELWREEYATVHAYAKADWGWTAARLYQFVKAGPAIAKVVPVLDGPVPESQAVILAPVLDSHGAAAVRESVAYVEKSGRKVTAANLATAVRKLGYVPSAKESEAATAPAATSVVVDDQEQAELPAPAKPVRAERTAVERLEDARERLGRVANLVSRTAVHDATGEHPAHAARVLRALTADVVLIAGALGLRVVGEDGKPLS